MTEDFLYVQVPADCWAQLKQDGFREVEIVRGPDQWVDVVQVGLSIGEHLLSDVGGLVGVYAARGRLAELARRLAFWTGGRAAVDAVPQSSAEPPAGRPAVVMTLISSGDAGRRISLECPIGPDGRPGVDTDVLAGALTAMLSTGSTGPAGSTGRPASKTPKHTDAQRKPEHDLVAAPRAHLAARVRRGGPGVQEAAGPGAQRRLRRGTGGRLAAAGSADDPVRAGTGRVRTAAVGLPGA